MPLGSFASVTGITYDSRTMAKLLVSLAVFLLLLLGPLPGDLPPQGQRVVAVVGLAVSLWITQVIPFAITGLLAVVLLVLLNGTKDLETALSGFASPVAYFLIGILALGLGVRNSGLAERVAGMFIAQARGRPRLLFVQMLASFPLVTFLLPSATTRNAILIHVYDQVLERWEIPRGAPLAKALMIGLGSLNRLASTALLTGGRVPVFAAALLGGFPWFRWFVLLAIPFYTLLVVGGVFLYIRFREGLGADPIRTLIAERKPWSVAEIKMTIIAVLVGTLWVTDSLHGLSPVVPALIALVLVLTPGIGVLDWSEFERDLGWSNFFILATSLSLANALIDSGATKWLVDGILVKMGSFDNAPVVLLMVFMMTGVAIRLAIPSIEGYLALTIPVAVSLAGELGLNPIVCGLAVMIAGDAPFFYPAQSASGIVVYTRGHVTGGEIFGFGVLMTLAAVGMVLLVALPYWALVGEHL
ncbi:anion permease [Dehalococcoidia bacterium]|nr:anion permease [Dehalococcoidia bacterium]